MCRFSLAWLALVHPSKPFDAMNILFMAVVFFPFGPCFGVLEFYSFCTVQVLSVLFPLVYLSSVRCFFTFCH